MFELIPYNDSCQIQWDDLIASSKNGVFFQKRGYLSYHLHRFDERSLLILKKGKVVALFPATAHETSIVSHGGITFSGLIMHHDLKTAEVIEVFENLKDYYKRHGFTSILYKASPYIFHKYPAQEDLYALFRSDAVLIRRDISTCILIADKIRFSETKRQSVRKCEKNNVHVKEQINFTDFWSLLSEVVAKHGAKPVHSLDEIKLLHERFPSQIKLFEARMNEQLLAGAVVFDFGRTVHTQYMANSEEGRSSGALDFLIHKLITDYFADRTYFNFGISTEEQGQVLNEGLVLQKEMMGGRGVVYDFYKINLL